MKNTNFILTKDIKNYEGLYQITSNGQVISYSNGYKKILKQRKNKDGYWYVVLCVNNERKTMKVHLLVVRAFLKQPEKTMQANHKDMDKDNNNLSNLNYMTARENTTHHRKQQKYTSKYTGVCWSKAANKWYSSIYVNGKTLFLGLFEQEINAHYTYQNCLAAHNDGKSVESFIVKPKLGGISFHKKSKRYIVRITHNSKRIHIGCYKAEPEAIEALNKYKQSTTN